LFERQINAERMVREEGKMDYTIDLDEKKGLIIYFQRDKTV